MLDAVGRSATRQAAVQAAGPGGTVVLPGLHDQETSCDVHAIIRSQVALPGSSASSQDDGRRAASLLEEGQVILEIFAALLISCVTLYRYVSLLAQYGRQSSLPVDHVPVRFAFGRPTPASHRSLDFASGVRWEPQDALDWGERTRSRTVRTFHHCDATIGKPFGINGNHPKKRAFGCFARLHLFLDRFHPRDVQRDNLKQKDENQKSSSTDGIKKLREAPTIGPMGGFGEATYSDAHANQFLRNHGGKTGARASLVPLRSFRTRLSKRPLPIEASRKAAGGMPKAASTW